ncbi:hypothetical protein BDV96DRAFT_168175 [Lophiotrema nucula]|uniref:Heterokaryon incompatibility domain-containing protein n=1 Tax=Lophiotrema nucula TaxID=690887 RepID=A0A6A5YZ19_9PLEO|nr:hypothetical protein BDV96DRAFT_168175 [Lophiotrema nucula]
MDIGSRLVYTRNRIQYNTIDVAWPRRLLHIPSMTSIERTGTCTYSGIESPKYAVITYTWGRFQAPCGSPALPIKGTTWKIPPVLDTCFSVQSFQNVIDYIGETYEWIWLDVACIDQEQEEVKMSEVARQVGIFHGAMNAYAWLHSLPACEVDEGCQALGRIAWYHPLHRDDSSDESDNEVEERDKLILAHYKEQLQFIEETLHSIFLDPWFTSLWTLQESILRRDAYLLARDGLPIGHKAEMTVNEGGEVRSFSRWRTETIDTLGMSCRSISQSLQRYLDQGSFSKPDSEKATRILRMIEKVGFNFADAMNPNVQYSAARFRETNYPLDRIYGIVGIYRSVIPDSVQLPNPSEVTFDGLETAFASALNQSSPWLGQCFVHLEEPKPGKSWRIAQSSSVPRQLQEINANSPINYEGHFLLEDSGRVVAKGKACPMQVLWAYWSKMRQRGSPWATTWIGYPMTIAYDRIISEMWPACPIRRSYGPVVEWTNPELPDSQNDFSMTQHLLRQTRAQDLYVLHLGYQDGSFYRYPRGKDSLEVGLPVICRIVVSGCNDADEGSAEPILEEQGITWGLRLEKELGSRQRALGVILWRNDRGNWQRVGICTWFDHSKTRHDLIEWECPIF